MRIPVSPSATGTIAIRLISAAQRQSVNSVEPASSRRSNFDITPRPRGKVYVYQRRSPSEFNWFSPVIERATAASRRRGPSSEARGGGGLGAVNMRTVNQTTRLIAWVIVGLIVLGILLYLFGPAALRTDELVVIGLLIIGLIWFQVWLRRRAQ